MNKYLLVFLATLAAVVSSPARADSKRFLIVISAADALTLRNGKVIGTGYFPIELVSLLKRLDQKGWKYDVATPGAKEPTVDLNSFDPLFYLTMDRLPGGQGKKLERRQEEVDYIQTLFGRLLFSSALPATSPFAKRFADDLRVGQKDKKLDLPLLDFGRALEHLKAGKYDAIAAPGGHAPMVDLAQDKALGELLTYAKEHDIPIGLICHAPVALLSAVTIPTTDGQPWWEYPVHRDSALREKWPFRGFRIAVASSAEERLVENLRYLRDSGRVPYYVDHQLKRMGARLDQGFPSHSHVVVDRMLVTGQNPASVDEWSAAMIDEVLERE